MYDGRYQYNERLPSSWTCAERVENDLKYTVYLYAAYCVGHHSSVSVTTFSVLFSREREHKATAT